MKTSDLKAFSAFLLAVAEMYQRKLTDSTVALYFESLKDLDLSQIKHGVKLHCEDQDEGKFMPLPAHIRGKIAHREKTPLLAWAQVVRTMESHGSYSSVRFVDGVINAVIRDMGGWPWICVQDISEPWTQKEFERRYADYKLAMIESQEHLPGLHETENVNRGYLAWVPPTALIGEHDEVTKLPPRFANELEAAGEDDLAKKQ